MDRTLCTKATAFDALANIFHGFGLCPAIKDDTVTVRYCDKSRPPIVATTEYRAQPNRICNGAAILRLEEERSAASLSARRPTQSVPLPFCTSWRSPTKRKKRLRSPMNEAAPAERPSYLICLPGLTRGLFPRLGLAV